MLIVLSILSLQQCANKASQVSPEVPHAYTNSEEELNSNLIPLEDFFKNPEKTAFQISSDGQKVAFLQPWEHRLNVHIQSLGSDEVIRLTSATERDIAGYLWLGNNRIGYVQDTGGDENFRLYAVDIDGSNQADLTPFDSV